MGSVVTPIFVCRVDNEEETGVIVSEHIIPNVVTDKNGQQRVEQVALLGVCWDDKRSPAIDYVYPNQLEWIGIAGITDTEDDEETEGDEDDEVPQRARGETREVNA